MSSEWDELGRAKVSKEVRVGPLGSWRWLGLLVLAVAAQVVAIFILPPTDSVALIKRALVVSGHLLALVAAWQARRVRGMGLVTLGLALNLIVMLANGGAMPVSPEARAARGVPVTEVALGQDIPRSKGILLTRGETRLWLLSDIFVITSPVRKAMSVGDIVLLTGAFLALIHLGGLLLDRRQPVPHHRDADFPLPRISEGRER